MPAVRSRMQIYWDPDPIVWGEAILEVDEALSHVEIPLAFSAELVSEDIKRRFDTESDPSGAPWQEWSDNYKDYAEAFPNTGILRQTDETYDAATDPEAMIVSGNTLFFDENVLPDQGFYNNDGAPNRRTKGGSPNPLPARPFLGLSDEASGFIFATFEEWFEQAIMIFETPTGKLGMKHQLRAPGSQGRFVPRKTPLPRRPR